MIFRLTQKLSKKLDIVTTQTLPPDSNRYVDWCSHLFTVQRKQYIILTNTRSLYSVVIHGRGVSSDKTFIQESLNCMEKVMIIDGISRIFENRIQPFINQPSFCKMTDKRVLGSMNDLIKQAKIYIERGGTTLVHISLLLNESPMSYLKYDCPADYFKVTIN